MSDQLHKLSFEHLKKMKFKKKFTARIISIDKKNANIKCLSSRLHQKEAFWTTLFRCIIGNIIFATIYFDKVKGELDQLTGFYLRSAKFIVLTSAEREISN